MDTYVIWDVTDCVIVFMTESAGRADRRVDVLSAVYNAVIECLPVLSRSDAFQYGICHHRCGIVADHAASVARAGPFWKELVLVGDVGQTLLNLLIHRRIHEVK